MSRGAITSALCGDVAAAQGTKQGRASAFTSRHQQQGSSPAAELDAMAAPGLGVPTPGCLCQRDSSRRLADPPHKWQSTGHLDPHPWLFGAARTQGRAHIDI